MTPDIISAVSTVGFPIAACCVMGWFCNSLVKDFNKNIVDLTKAVDMLGQRFDELDHDINCKKEVKE